MGPYCKFCDQRCFIPMPAETPREILAAYGTATIVATCPAGKRFEKETVGYCLDDIRDRAHHSPHVHGRECYDDAGPGHGPPSLICQKEVRS